MCSQWEKRVKHCLMLLSPKIICHIHKIVIRSHQNCGVWSTFLQYVWAPPSQWSFLTVWSDRWNKERKIMGTIIVYWYKWFMWEDVSWTLGLGSNIEAVGWESHNNNCGRFTENCHCFNAPADEPHKKTFTEICSEPLGSYHYRIVSVVWEPRHNIRISYIQVDIIMKN